MCSDPNCAVCVPLRAYQTSMPLWESMVMPSYSPFSSNASNIKMTINTAYNDALKEQPVLNSKTKQALEAVRGLDESELPTISAEVEAIKSKNKARIADSLNGVVDLAAMGKPKLRRFVIAYFIASEAKTAEGVELGETGYIPEAKTTDESRVWVSGNDYPVLDNHYTMERLRKRLDDSGISYKIKYFDK